VRADLLNSQLQYGGWDGHSYEYSNTEPASLNFLDEEIGNKQDNQLGPACEYWLAVDVDSTPKHHALKAAQNQYMPEKEDLNDHTQNGYTNRVESERGEFNEVIGSHHKLKLFLLAELTVLNGVNVLLLKDLFDREVDFTDSI
jgi:hypothetical protein